MDAYLAFRTLGAILPRIPARLGYAIAGWLARLNYRRDVEAVQGLRDNIHHAMGSSASAAQVEEATRQAYGTLLRNYFDLFRLPALTVEQLRSAIPITGWEIVESARAWGRGVLLCSAHLGDIEAALQIATVRGLHALAPAEHVQPERLYRYLADLRSRHGLRLIPSDGPMLELFRALRRGEAVGLALDRDSTGSGVEVTLCGGRARIPDGFARVAAKTRAPIVIGFCYRLPGGGLQVRMGPLFVPDPVADREEIYCAALDFGVRELERAVTAHPDQWTLTTPLWIADD
jgi:KDO2-lipid IV(A) lauroyltransferase